MAHCMFSRLIGCIVLLSCLSVAWAQAPGASMDQVRAMRGEPQSIRGPVGEPPITTWVYAGDLLYFEYEQLIIVVPRDAHPELQRKDGLRSPTPES